MNYLKRLLTALSFVLLLFSISCHEDNHLVTETETTLHKKADNRNPCISPDEIGVIDFVLTSSFADGITFNWNPITGVFAYEFEMYVNSAASPVVSVYTNTTSIYTESYLNIGDIVRGQVRSVCQDHQYSEWVDIDIMNKNGGATVDDVPSFEELVIACNESPCEYVKFSNNEVSQGTEAIDLGLKKGGVSCYLKAEICPCVNANQTDWVDCLYPAYLKRNYTICD